MKKVVLCIPGNVFTKEFVKCLIDTIALGPTVGIAFRLSLDYDAVVHFARAKCLGANVLRGENQLPFGGEVDYDYILWIDSDIMFSINHIVTLINHFEQDSQKDVVSGWYSMIDGKNSTMVQHMDDEFFKTNAFYQFTSIEEMNKLDRLVSCDYVGMGFMMIKKNVFEKLKYPWFYDELTVINNNIKDMCSEDVAFCKKMRREGIKIWVDPKCRVGHQKLVVL
jgi:cellulose synthase/poly-beta-1,6-N-acetylglucosamine synthase-like glycosyltransferase